MERKLSARRCGAALLAAARNSGLLWILFAGSSAMGQPDLAPPGQSVFLAYEPPLPDSVRKAIAEVKVLDDDTGLPIARAEVMVLNIIENLYRTSLTDDQGTLRFAYPFGEGPPQVNIEVRKEGYVPQRAGWGFEEDQVPRRMTMRLRPGTLIGGRVTDEHGRPIEGVTVVATVDKYEPGDRLVDPLGHEFLYEVPFRTDREGRWRTGSCPTGAREISLQLVHPDYISGDCETLGGRGLRRPPIEKLFEQSDVQIMAKGVRLEGRVVDPDGKPIPNARIVESSKGFTFLTHQRGATSGQDGCFHLHFGANTEVQLTAEARGFAPLTLRTTAKPDTGPIEFRLTRGKTMRGKVVDPQGKPVATAVVLSPTNLTNPFFLRKYTDSHGQFVWDGAPEEPVTLMVLKDGYRGADLIQFTSDGKENVVILSPNDKK